MTNVSFSQTLASNSLAGHEEHNHTPGTKANTCTAAQLANTHQPHSHTTIYHTQVLSALVLLGIANFIHMELRPQVGPMPWALTLAPATIQLTTCAHNTVNNLTICVYT